MKTKQPRRGQESAGRMTPAEKLKAALRLYHSARALKAASLRASHPQWSEEELDRRVREVFLYARG